MSGKTKTLNDNDLKCFHCGNECSDESISIQAKVFCCSGCKTVFEILSENSLCDYYALEDKPGNRVEDKSEKNFEYLDDQKIKNELLNFHEGEISGVTLYIPSIHCSSCIWLLENLQKIHPGIISAHIHFQKKELDIQFNEKITLRELVQLLVSLGYEPSISLNGKKVTGQSVNKSLYYKLGVAGFCFGNIMMLSLPEYLSVFDDFTGPLKFLFSSLSVLLAIPVIFYSASDYFYSTWQGIKNKVINIDLPIALGIMAAFLQSVYEIVSVTGAGYMDSLAGLVFFLLVGKWYQSKTYRALSFDRDYKSYFPLAATKLEDGEKSYVQLHELKTGDTILVKNQEIIPADSIILDGDASIDYSFVTGESVPVSKKTGEQVYAGGKQIGTPLKLMISKDVSQSYLTQLWNKDTTKSLTTGLQDFTNKVGKYFTIVVVILSLSTYFYWVGKDPQVALNSAVTVLVIFCPCIFSLAIPFCFGNAMNILGRNGLFLKNKDSIEKLADTDTLVFDKTGTITYAGQSEIEFTGLLNEKERQMVKSLAANSTHPLSRVIADYFKKQKTLALKSYHEIPSLGIEGKIDGSVIKLGSSRFIGNQFIHGEGRTNNTSVYIEIDGELKGCFIFKNKYRKNLYKVLAGLRSHYSLHLLSGDNEAEKSILEGAFDRSKLHFNQSPTDKLEYVKDLGVKNKVLMIGDGLNDAGALLNSHCGISITEDSGNFSPACDAILEASSFERLPVFMRYARLIRQTIYWTLGLSLCYNLFGLFFAIQGKLHPLFAAILMPISSVSVVLFVIVMSNLLGRRLRL